MLTSPIKAYLYQGFNDDDDVRAFFTAYNALAQQFYDWMLNVNMPIFIGGYNAGNQLYWLVYGLYGVTPPSMVSSKKFTYGPYSHIIFNDMPYNALKVESQNTQVLTSDDVFKRILTWNFYKGDGFTFSVPWLKRRVRRFLEGTNGVDITNDQQWGVSVVFDGSGGITINLSSERSTFINLAFASIFKSAFENNLLHMPFWASVTVTVD